MMKCTVCGRRRRMTDLRFVADGLVPKVLTPKHNAVCIDCMRKEPASNSDAESASESPRYRDELPF